MPEWTAEVIWSVGGAALVALLVGWAIGRFGGTRVARADFERTVAEERTARHELTAARARSRRLEDELASLTATLAERTVDRTETARTDAARPEPVSTLDPPAPTRAIRDAPPPHHHRSAARTAGGTVDLRRLEGLNASLLDELDAARQRFAGLHASQAGLADELQRVCGRVADLEAQNRTLGSELEASTRRVDQLDELQTRIDRHLSRGRDQVARFDARTGTHADDLAQARARVGEVEATLQQAVAALQDTRSELDALGIDLRTPPTPAIDLREGDRSTVDAAADAADADAERRSGRIETWRA